MVKGLVGSKIATLGRGRSGSLNSLTFQLPSGLVARTHPLEFGLLGAHIPRNVVNVLWAGRTDPKKATGQLTGPMIGLGKKVEPKKLKLCKTLGVE
jgi:hypothetical protein